MAEMFAWNKGNRLYQQGVMVKECFAYWADSAGCRPPKYASINDPPKWVDSEASK